VQNTPTPTTEQKQKRTFIILSKELVQARQQFPLTGSVRIPVYTTKVRRITPFTTLPPFLFYTLPKNRIPFPNNPLTTILF